MYAKPWRWGPIWWVTGCKSERLTMTLCVAVASVKLCLFTRCCPDVIRSDGRSLHGQSRFHFIVEQSTPVRYRWLSRNTDVSCLNFYNVGRLIVKSTGSTLILLRVRAMKWLLVLGSMHTLLKKSCGCHILTPDHKLVIGRQFPWFSGKWFRSLLSNGDPAAQYESFWLSERPSSQ